MTIEGRESAIIKAENVRIGPVVKIGVRGLEKLKPVVSAYSVESCANVTRYNFFPAPIRVINPVLSAVSISQEVAKQEEIIVAKFIPRTERSEPAKVQVNAQMLRGVNEYKKAAQVFTPKVDDVIEAQWRLRYVDPKPGWILNLFKILAKKLGLTKIWQWLIKPLIVKNISEPIYIRILSGQYQVLR